MAAPQGRAIGWMMIAQRFNPVTDLEVLNSWLMARGLDSICVEELPRLGVIVYSADDAIACGFIRLVEGRMCIFDGLASNPEMPSDVRHRGLDLAISKLLDRAESMGLERVIAWSVDKGTLERAARHGFVASPNALIFKNLGAPISH